MAGAPLITFALGDHKDPQGNKMLAQFKAGRAGPTKEVNLDQRAGYLYLYQSIEDWLIHFCWRESSTDEPELNIIVYQDECVFVQVEAHKTLRMLVLRNKTNSKRLYFWMQEPKTNNDEAWCKRINEVINNPPEMEFPGPVPYTIVDIQSFINEMLLEESMGFMMTHKTLPSPKICLASDLIYREAKLKQRYMFHQYRVFVRRRHVEISRMLRDKRLEPDGSYDKNETLSVVDEIIPSSDDDESSSEDEDKPTSEHDRQPTSVTSELLHSASSGVEATVTTDSIVERHHLESQQIQQSGQLDSVNSNVENEGQTTNETDVEDEEGC